MKPILFNTEMVQAILEGRKTVTRRVVKLPSYVERQPNGLFTLFAEGTCYENQHIENMTDYLKPPYQVNDILYVRETFFQAVSHYLDISGESVAVTHSIFEYLADGQHKKGHWYNDRQDYYMVKRPSIHMPKEAARIFLRVTDVSVERLQDITEKQAEAEGIRSYTKDEKLYKYAASIDWWEEFHYKHRKMFRGNWWQDMPRTATEAFCYLWDSTLGRRGTPEYQCNCWKGNPYVWVIEFEKLECSSMAEALKQMKEG